jgi:hypothetical protein
MPKASRFKLSAPKKKRKSKTTDGDGAGQDFRSMEQYGKFVGEYSILLIIQPG